MTTVAWAEAAARRFETDQREWDTPGDLALALDPRTKQTPMLDLIDAVLVDAIEQSYTGGAEGARKIILTPPQEGKSQRVSRRFPLWCLVKNPDLRIAITSYEANTARRWGRAIRDDVRAHPELGLRLRGDVSAQSEWEVDGRLGGVYTAGVGGALTGRAVDVLIIDDPVKDREQADSDTYRERVWDWWTDTAKTRLAPGAPVILVMTHWHPDDLASRLIAEGGWDVLTIPAQCEDPETDPLHRAVGEFLESVRGRTVAQWERIKATTTVRTWMALYQQRPTPAEGVVWIWEWINKHRQPSGTVLHNLTRRLVSVDPAVKSKKTSDLTGIIVLGMDALGEFYVFDDRSGRYTPKEAGLAIWSALLFWEADEVVVEDNQGGEYVVFALESSWEAIQEKLPYARMQPKITVVSAYSSKRIRAEAVAAKYELGHVHHVNDGTQRLNALETQMTSWTGDGDSPDRIDALDQGITALATPQTHQRQSRTRTR